MSVCRQGLRLVLLTMAALGLGLHAATANADTIYVPDDYPTIQEGINAAFDGDEVVVADGTWTGAGNKDLDFGGKPITVRSENGPDQCIIDCEGSSDDPHRGFYFHNGEGPDSVVEGLTITNGYADLYGGGGICCENDSSPTIRNCTFSGNWAGSGGGVRCLYSSPTITNCTFTENVADHSGAGSGGGINYCGDYGASLTITNCIFSGNSAGYAGGGIKCSGNEDVYASLTLINCTFVGNSADGYGGGGGLRSGSLISPTIVNCTFSGNWAVYGGGISSVSPALTIVNCVLWGDIASQSGPELYVFHGITTIAFSDIEGGEAAVYVDPRATLNWGEGNIDADPLFIDPDNADYRLSIGSPCIDAGDNEAVPEGITTDLEGNPRFVDDGDTEDTGNGSPPIVDMGAYEFQYVIPGDLDGDGCVDHRDLGILLAYWGWSDGGDCDGDGDTDHADLGILLSHWGEGCP